MLVVGLPWMPTWCTIDGPAGLSVGAVTTLRRFTSYYTRSSLPFLSGLAYGVFLANWDHSLWLQVLAGFVLVVLGPFAIQLVLTLIVDALRGVPDEPGVTPRHIRPIVRPSESPFTRSREPRALLGRLTRER